MWASGGGTRWLQFRRIASCSHANSRSFFLLSGFAASFTLCRGESQCEAKSEGEADNLKSWDTRWEANQIGWHLKDVHPTLRAHLKELFPVVPSEGHGGLAARIMIPLCGKTVDMAWLSGMGYRVVGFEGVGKAIEEFAQEHSATGEAVSVAFPADIDPKQFKGHAMMPIPSEKDTPVMPQPVIIIEGDFLALGKKEAQVLVPFPAAFDRGSMVAVKPEVRKQYMQVMADMMAPGGRVLLVTVEHDPFKDGVLGPPHSIPEADLRELCKGVFDVKQLARVDNFNQDSMFKQRGSTFSFEAVYLLTRKEAK